MIKYYSIDEFCEMTGISRMTFYRRVEDGLAPATIKFGRRVLISESAYLEWQRKIEEKAQESK